VLYAHDDVVRACADVPPTNRAKRSWLFVTSHEIYHITETHYCACTRVGLPEGAANGA
jgi:hypothetical protein